MNKRLFIGLLFFLLYSHFATAQTYTIGPGELEATIRIARAGDRIIAKDGIYTDINNDGIVVDVSQPWLKGTPSNRISIEAEHPYAAIIDGQNTARDCWYLESGNQYFVISGFQLRNCKQFAFEIWAQHFDIVQNHIHDIGHECSSLPGIAGIYFAGDAADIGIRRNVFSNIGRLKKSNGCAMETASLDHALYLSAGSDIKIINNVCLNAAGGWCVHLYGSSPRNNIYIAHNTFANNATFGGGIVIGEDEDASVSAINNLTVEYNIVFGVGAVIVHNMGCGGRANVVIRGNLGNAPKEVDNPCDFVVADNRPGVNPKFVDQKAGNLRLKSGSPAIDTINPANDPVKRDLDGIARPVNGLSDIGAFEYHL